MASGSAGPGGTKPPGRKKSRKPSAASVQHAAIVAPHGDTLSATTASAEARALYEAGIVAWETLQTDSALKRWRMAANIDPEFALAHLFLSYCTSDPAEAQREREKANFLAKYVTPSERLLITWFNGVRENQYLSGIPAMNELVQQYPKDKHILVWAGSWLFHERDYELAQKRLEQAVAIDPDFAAALNDLGYIYAYQGDYHQALSVMQHYVELLPHEPNPQDSYAEILRMAGRYDDALEHYRLALKIDPNFHSSQLGIADTYTLMGQQSRARQEYFNARVLATDKATELADLMQSAFTYVRERDFSGADLAFQGVAQQARHAGLSIIEAEAWRMRARLQFITAPNDLVAAEISQGGKRLGLIRRKRAPRPELEYLANADQALKEAKAISESDRQDEYALLVRERAEAAGRRGLFAQADEAVAQLEAMAGDNPRATIQRALTGAKGAVLLYQGKYDEAVALLDRDNDNAFSLFRSAYVGGKTGKTGMAPARLAAALAFTEPTAEQAFVGKLFELGSVSKEAHLSALGR
jgi:tetratricopeptide (TPR) repeat protein